MRRMGGEGSMGPSRGSLVIRMNDGSPAIVIRDRSVISDEKRRGGWEVLPQSNTIRRQYTAGEISGLIIQAGIEAYEAKVRMLTGAVNDAARLQRDRGLQNVEVRYGRKAVRPQMALVLHRPTEVLAAMNRSVGSEILVPMNRAGAGGETGAASWALIGTLVAVALMTAAAWGMSILHGAPAYITGGGF